MSLSDVGISFDELLERFPLSEQELEEVTKILYLFSINYLVFNKDKSL